MKIAAIQMTPSVEPGENFEAMRLRAAEAAAEGARVIVFPEQAMVLLQSVTVDALTGIAAEWWERFVALTAELAVQHDAVVISAGFEPSTDGLPYNTVIAVGPGGEELARYRKLHLYKAFAQSEFEHTRAGDELPPVFDVEVDGEALRFGLANCYDIRFPELFRSLVDRGANAVAVVAAWASGPGKEDHWSILTRARALESVSWLVASAAVGGGSRDAATTGLSRIVDPLGEVVAGLGPRGEGIVLADVDPAVVDRARGVLPALENRRIALAYELA
ncbi:putative amidohydrolase [Leucobacter komagatae]|uniref:Putative amidohydrolase n=1 Tax=Leucobacter komagatae TaxID=55969 RepID=A0A542Y8X3_9MICO|nr:nitrilase-related carbon-nitrogen hydrolase [Leucobacter komagatae]TQL44538.1 putative amidohydrolase [Leucobacter komagatae]